MMCDYNIVKIERNQANMKKWLIFIFIISVVIISFIFTGCGAAKPYDYNLSDYVALANYKGVEVSTAKIEETMENNINSLLEEHKTSLEITDRPTKKGDVVVIDFIGTMGGEAFDGGTANNYEVELGSGALIDGFEDGLIGKNIGEQVKLELNFPDDYEVNPDLSGKRVDFDVTIKSISEVIIPKLTDEFISTLENSKFQTVEEYKADLRNSAKRNLVWQNIVDNSTILKFPKKEVKAYYDKMVKNYETMAVSQYNTTLPKFIQYYMGSDVDSFLNSLLETSKMQSKKDIILYSIARNENITYESDDYDEIALDYAKSYGYETLEQFKAQYGTNEVNRSVLSEKVVKYVTESSVEVK